MRPKRWTSSPEGGAASGVRWRGSSRAYTDKLIPLSSSLHASAASTPSIHTRLASVDPSLGGSRPPSPSSELRFAMAVPVWRLAAALATPCPSARYSLSGTMALREVSTCTSHHLIPHSGTMFDSPETCIRTDTQDADASGLLSCAAQLATATYKQCNAPPSRERDHWAVLHRAVRAPPARPHLWPMPRERAQPPPHVPPLTEPAQPHATRRFAVDLARDIAHDRCAMVRENVGAFGEGGGKGGMRRMGRMGRSFGVALPVLFLPGPVAG